MPRSLDATLTLVTDRDLARGRPLLDVVSAAVAGGVTAVQLREKTATTAVFLELAGQLQRHLQALGVPLVINDRVDVALGCGAAGLHVGQDDMPCAVARRLAGDTMVIGVSVTTPAEARRAEDQGADYLGVGPVFATPTKVDSAAPLGLAGLEAIRAVTRLPLVAIGGLSARNAADVTAAGADGIAVVSAIMAADDPAAAARALGAAIDEGRQRGRGV